MAQESCNINKDEAEVLKPSSSSAPPPSASSHTTTQLSSSSSMPMTSLGVITLEFPDAVGTQASDAPVENTHKLDRETAKSVDFVNRCFSCRKRVGLTGFHCRCGHLFCPHHRYSDIHDCTFDYKAAGRAEISRNNPLIRAAKIIRI